MHALGKQTPHNGGSHNRARRRGGTATDQPPETGPTLSDNRQDVGNSCSLATFANTDFANNYGKVQFFSVVGVFSLVPDPKPRDVGRGVQRRKGGGEGSQKIFAF